MYCHSMCSSSILNYFLVGLHIFISFLRPDVKYVSFKPLKYSLEFRLSDHWRCLISIISVATTIVPSP